MKLQNAKVSLNCKGPIKGTLFVEEQETLVSMCEISGGFIFSRYRLLFNRCFLNNVTLNGSVAPESKPDGPVFSDCYLIDVKVPKDARFKECYSPQNVEYLNRKGIR